jgi:hypothetical protein
MSSDNTTIQHNTQCVEQSVLNVVKLNTAEDMQPLLEQSSEAGENEGSKRVTNRVNITRDFLDNYLKAHQEQTDPASNFNNDSIYLDGDSSLNLIQNAAVVIINYNCCGEDDKNKAKSKKNKTVVFNLAKVVETKIPDSVCKEQSHTDTVTTQNEEKTPTKREIEDQVEQQVETKKKKDEHQQASGPFFTLMKSSPPSPPPPPPVVTSLYSPSMTSLPNALSPDFVLPELIKPPVTDSSRIFSRPVSPTSTPPPLTSRILRSPPKPQQIPKPSFVLTHVHKQVIRRIVQRQVPCC